MQLKRKERPDDVLKVFRRGLETVKREGPVISQRPDCDKILLMRFVTSGYGNHLLSMHRILVSVLQEVRFSGFGHYFDLSLPQDPFYVAGLGFSAELSGEPYNIFSDIWPLLLRHFSWHPNIKIVAKSIELGKLGYVRKMKRPTSTVLFYNGSPRAALTGSSMFEITCYEEFFWKEGGSLRDFFRDPLEPWTFKWPDSLQQTDDVVDDGLF